MATAFDFDEHAAAKDCLKALERLARANQFKRPLDLGCGSGILAMDIAQLWDKSVLAVDHDPEARVTDHKQPFITFSGHNFWHPLLSLVVDNSLHYM